MFKFPLERPVLTRFCMTVELDSLGNWLNGSSSSIIPQELMGEAWEIGSLGASFFSPAATAFRAAFAFAIVSRNVLDDLEAFLAWLSACCSADSSSCTLEEAEACLVTEGEGRGLDVCAVPTFRVFLTWSGLSGGPMFELGGFPSSFAVGLLSDGRGCESFPLTFGSVDFSVKGFLGGELISNRGAGFFNLDGLILSSEARAGE